MLISLIGAMAKNRVIGVEGRILPWHLSADLKRFRAMTHGHAVIMGRKTWAKFPKPLPNRLNIVVSRTLIAQDVPSGVLIAKSLDEALALAPKNESEAFVIGGAEIFAAAMNRADRIYLTVIEIEAEGDTYFPHIPDGQFRVAHQESHEEDGTRFQYLDYTRAR